MLAQVDIVGTIESFDASLLLLWEAIGVPPHLGDALGVHQLDELLDELTISAGDEAGGDEDESAAASSSQNHVTCSS